MGRGRRPVLAGAAVVVAVFLLAQLVPFEPSTSVGTTTTGDAERGQVLFADTCASCHGGAGEGGVGPALAGSGLSADEIATTIEQGKGVMPAGLLDGQDRADVVAYVVSVATP